MQHEENVDRCHVSCVLRQLDKPRVIEKQGFGVIGKLCNDIRHELVGRGCGRYNGRCQRDGGWGSEDEVDQALDDGKDDPRALSQCLKDKWSVWEIEFVLGICQSPMRGRQPLLSDLEGLLTTVRTFLESPQLKSR